MVENTETPEDRSSDFDAMVSYWDMVETILNGAPAMRKAGKKYLPKFPNESGKDYEYRSNNAKFTNIYRDIVESLAAKPFSKEVLVNDGKNSDSIKALIEDIDGQGNHLHVFASNMFFNGINNAIDWVFIDKSPVPDGASLADEKALGARPYWVHVPAKMMLAVYSDVINGKEEFIHARIHEPSMKRVGFKEVAVERVRVLNREKLLDGSYGPATWTLWEEIEDEKTDKEEWVEIASGTIGIGIIAIVPFITGRRKEGTWQLVPPMQDAAYLQIEHFQQETNLKSIKEQACFPMLAGNGVSIPVDDMGKPIVVPVGPKTVLFAPTNSEGQSGSWSFIEPNAQSLKFLAEDVKTTELQLRELGRQPLTAQSGNMTVVATAYAASKANTVIQAWALGLKDTLENAFVFTGLWLNDTTKTEVTIYTDFGIDLDNTNAPDFILGLSDRGIISRETVIREAKRRDLLAPEYDGDEDLNKIIREIPGDGETEIITSPMQDAKGAQA